MWPGKLTLQLRLGEWQVGRELYQDKQQPEELGKAHPLDLEAKIRSRWVIVPFRLEAVLVHQWRRKRELEAAPRSLIRGRYWQPRSASPALEAVLASEKAAVTDLCSRIEAHHLCQGGMALRASLV